MHGHMKCSLGWNQYFMWAYILLLEQSQQYGCVQNLFYRPTVIWLSCLVWIDIRFLNKVEARWGYIN